MQGPVALRIMHLTARRLAERMALSAPLSGAGLLVVACPSGHRMRSGSKRVAIQAGLMRL